jgi:hypothetical protein
LLIGNHKNANTTLSTQNEEEQQKSQDEESPFFVRNFISRLLNFLFMMFGNIPNEVLSYSFSLSLSFFLSFFPYFSLSLSLSLSLSSSFHLFCCSNFR